MAQESNFFEETSEECDTDDEEQDNDDYWEADNGTVCVGK